MRAVTGRTVKTARKNLYLRGAVWWATYTENGRSVRRSLHVTDFALAQIALGKIQRRLEEGRVGIVKRTAADLWDERIEHARAHVAPSTARRYIPLLGRLRDHFSVLTARRVSEWVALRLAQGRSVSTINYEIGLVRGMMAPEEAARVSRIKDRQAATEQRPRYLTGDEVRLLLKASPVPFRAVLLGYLYTGCRLQELPAIPWEAISKTEVRIPNLKTVRSRSDSHRTVPLHPALCASLEAARAAGQAKPWQYPGAWEQQIRLHLIRYAKTAGIGWQPSPHTLRRTFASRLVSAGTDIFLVSRWLGHASVVQTERAYAYLAPSSQAVEILRLDW